MYGLPKAERRLMDFERAITQAVRRIIKRTDIGTLKCRPNVYLNSVTTRSGFIS